MMIEYIAAAAVLLSSLTYLWLGLRNYRRNRDISDHVPVRTSGRAAVSNSREFSASTVATTVSLTTVILAYFELAGYFGVWLLWTAVSTALGLLVVRLAAPVIWRRIDRSSKNLPSLHGHLGAGFASPLLRTTAATCTTLGFVGALAVELTVGSRFLAEVAGFDAAVTVMVLSSVAVVYTVLGGFRVVIETDRWQMTAIWVAIAALSVLATLVMGEQGGVLPSLQQMSPDLLSFGWRDGLGLFLVGIALLNIPTFIADMSIWQRISATRHEAALRRGLSRSVIGALISWTLLVCLALVITSIVVPGGSGNVLSQFLNLASGQGGLIIAALLFVIIVGLYAASLSTASTQLIAAAQSGQVDVLEDGFGSRLLAGVQRIRVSRFLILILGIGAILIVELLRSVGFGIADLVFAIFGSQLGIVPAVLLLLFGRPDLNQRRGSLVAAGVALGFAGGWATAFYGNAVGDGNLIFLAPVSSLVVSSVFAIMAVLKVRSQ